MSSRKSCGGGRKRKHTLKMEAPWHLDSKVLLECHVLKRPVGWEQKCREVVQCRPLLRSVHPSGRILEAKKSSTLPDVSCGKGLLELRPVGSSDYLKQKRFCCIKEEFNPSFNVFGTFKTYCCTLFGKDLKHLKRSFTTLCPMYIHGTAMYSVCF